MRSGYTGPSKTDLGVFHTRTSPNARAYVFSQPQGHARLMRFILGWSFLAKRARFLQTNVLEADLLVDCTVAAIPASVHMCCTDGISLVRETETVRPAFFRLSTGPASHGRQPGKHLKTSTPTPHQKKEIQQAVGSAAREFWSELGQQRAERHCHELL